jgi:glutamate transport system permease protein
VTAVLYDAPGPKARQRNRLFAVIGTALLAALVGFVIYRFVVTGQFEAQMWEWILYTNIQLLLLDGLLNTLRAFALAAVLSLVFGAVFAAGRLSDHSWISRPATAVVEFFRAVPLLILIFILYFGVSRGIGIDITAFSALVLGLMLYNGSVLAEIFRAGVVSLPRGQQEAAFALGMRKTQVMTNVLLPQALRLMLPTIISQLVVVLKDTSLGFIIGYEEVLRITTQVVQILDNQIQMYIVVGTIYILLNYGLSKLAGYAQRRLARGRKTRTLPVTAEAPAAISEPVL